MRDTAAQMRTLFDWMSPSSSAWPKLSEDLLCQDDCRRVIAADCRRVIAADCRRVVVVVVVVISVVLVTSMSASDELGAPSSAASELGEVRSRQLSAPSTMVPGAAAAAGPTGAGAVGRSHCVFLTPSAALYQ